jgi:CRAL/TRIO domain
LLQSQRQVGFDKQQRPVIYACFSQAACSHSTVEDTIVHMTHLVENAKRTMSGSVSTWVFIMDCTGQWRRSSVMRSLLLYGHFANGVMRMQIDGEHRSLN